MTGVDNVPRWQLWVGEALHGVYLFKAHAETVAERLRKKGKTVKIVEGYRV